MYSFMREGEIGFQMTYEDQPFYDESQQVSNELKFTRQIGSSSGITPCSDARVCGRSRKLITPTLELALQFAAQPYRLLALVDGDIGPPHHLPLRHLVAERHPLSETDGERPEDYGVLGRHEATVHGVASLPVQTLSGGEVPFGHRHHVGPEPVRNSGRFAP